MCAQRGLERLEPRFLPAAIAGVVYLDVDADGNHDPGEGGAAGVTVQLVSTPASTTGGLQPQQVLVVYNSARSDSLAVYEHYRSRRPGVRGLDLDDDALAPGNISYDDFVARIRDPIRRHLANHSLADQVVVLTLTRGLPHRILNMSGNPFVGDNPTDSGALLEGGNATYATVDSELTLLWQDLRHGPQLGERGGSFDSYADNYILNPYFNQTRSITGHRRAAIQQRVSFVDTGSGAWRWRRSGSGTRGADAGRMFLTTRLDGPTNQSVFDMIDRAQSIRFDTEVDTLLFDKRTPPDIDGGDYEAARTALADHWPQLRFDNSSAFLVGPAQEVPDARATVVTDPIAALVTYGANHSNASQAGYVSSFNGQLADGAIMLSFESYNARQFGPVGGFQGQGQLGAWVAAGGTLGAGTAWEPFGQGIARVEPVLANFLVNGLSWAEAAWSGIAQLSWQHVVLGDPLAVASFSAAPAVVTGADGAYRFADVDTRTNHQLRFDAPGELVFAPAPQGAANGVDPATERTPIFRAPARGAALASGLYAPANTPSLAVADAVGLEDTPIALSIAATSNDADDTETLVVHVFDVPDGALLSAGDRIDDGNAWSLSADQLTGLSITPPPDRDDPFDLRIDAIATEPVGGDAATASATLTVAPIAVADVPLLAVSDAVGPAGAPIPLPIEAASADRDGSEMLSVHVEDVPAGATLSGGSPDGAGAWTLAMTDLADLAITTSAGHLEPFTLRITATAREAANGATRSTQVALPVQPYAVATLDGAAEDSDFIVTHDALRAAAAVAGVPAAGMTFRIESILSGALALDGLPVAPGQTTLAPGADLTWRPADDEHGSIGAFRARVLDGGGPLLQYDIDTAAVNDAPRIEALTADAPVVGLGNRFTLTSTGVDDVDDAALEVRFHVDRNANGLVDGDDTFIGAVAGSGTVTADLASLGLALGTHALLAVAHDAQGAASAPIGTTLLITDVLGGPAEQDGTSRQAKKLATGIRDARGRPVSIELRGPGTVELIADVADDQPFRRLIVRGSDSTSVLSVRGATFLTDILVLGPAKLVSAADITLRGRIVVDGTLQRLRLGTVADQHEIRIGPGAVATRIDLGDVSELTIRSGSPIASLTTGTWEDVDGTPDVVAAPALDRLRVDGAFPADLELDGDLGRADIRGALRDAAWRVGGSTGSIRAAAIEPDWSARFGGAVQRLAVDGDAALDVVAPAIREVRVGGDIDGGGPGSILRLTGAADPGDPRRPALGRLQAGGAIVGLQVRSAGHIGLVGAAAIRDSLILAGLADDVSGLPTAADFIGPAPARLDALRIAGPRGTIWFADTTIAAAELGTMRFGFADTDGAGTAFGLAGRSLGRVEYRDARGVRRARTTEDLAEQFPLGRLEVRIV